MTSKALELPFEIIQLVFSYLRQACSERKAYRSAFRSYVKAKEESGLVMSLVHPVWREAVQQLAFASCRSVVSIGRLHDLLTNDHLAELVTHVRAVFFTLVGIASVPIPRSVSEDQQGPVQSLWEQLVDGLKLFQRATAATIDLKVPLSQSTHPAIEGTSMVEPLEYLKELTINIESNMIIPCKSLQRLLLLAPNVTTLTITARDVSYCRPEPSPVDLPHLTEFFTAAFGRTRQASLLKWLSVDTTLRLTKLTIGSLQDSLGWLRTPDSTSSAPSTLPQLKDLCVLSLWPGDDFNLGGYLARCTGLESVAITPERRPRHPLRNVISALPPHVKHLYLKSHPETVFNGLWILQDVRDLINNRDLLSIKISFCHLRAPDHHASPDDIVISHIVPLSHLAEVDITVDIDNIHTAFDSIFRSGRRSWRDDWDSEYGSSDESDSDCF